MRARGALPGLVLDLQKGHWSGKDPDSNPVASIPRVLRERAEQGLFGKLIFCFLRGVVEGGRVRGSK